MKILDLLDGLAEQFRSALWDVANALSNRIDTLEAREQFTATQARAMLDEAVAALPVPQDGVSVTLEDVRPLVDEAVKAIPAPKDGDHGTSVTVAEVLPALTEQVAAHLASLPVPQDGKSVTVSEVVEALQGPLEALHARWALDFERRAADVLQRACERIPKPRDGVDGMGFDHVEHTHDGERRGCWLMVRGDQVKEFPYRHEAIIDRGVFKEGSPYERGDAVTYGGSLWIAQKDDPEGKPGLSDDWRLAVRKGRDK